MHMPFLPLTLIITPYTTTLATGKTTIDLEDRWFDARWQKMGEENVLMPGADPNDPTKVRATMCSVCA